MGRSHASPPMAVLPDPPAPPVAPVDTLGWSLPGVEHEAHVVIVGGGFGGLTAAQALARAPVRITLVDRCNHHLFQPLLYQVAMAGLSPADIAVPIRSVLRRQRNVRVVLADVRNLSLA